MRSRRVAARSNSCFLAAACISFFKRLIARHRPLRQVGHLFFRGQGHGDVIGFVHRGQDVFDLLWMVSGVMPCSWL